MKTYDKDVAIIECIILMEECVKAEGNSELQYEKMNQLRKYKNILPRKFIKV